MLTGDGQDEAALAAGWDRVLGATHAFDDRVEYVHSTGEHWTTTVLGEMCVADTVVLHLSPKGLWFPHVFRPRPTCSRVSPSRHLRLSSIQPVQQSRRQRGRL